MVGSVANPPFGGSPLSGALPPSGAPPSPSTDNARSGSPESHSPPPTDSETEQTDLLSLRRDYHRAASQVMMSSHHLEFLGKCKEASHVPPGLRISLRPQVYASNASHMEESIKKIINSVQDEIIQALCTHYNSILEHAQNVLDQVSSTLSSSLSLLPPSQAAPHQQLMERTNTNLERKKKQLATRTERN